MTLQTAPDTNPMSTSARGRPSKRIAHILEHVRGPTILDVGCASHRPNLDSPHWLHGRLIQAFPNAWIVGFDYDSNKVQALRNAGCDHVVTMDAEAMYFSESFDTIVAGEVIEHLGNPLRFLETAAAHLKPGGRIVLTTPFPFSLYYGFGALLRHPKTCPNPEHACWFCPDTLTQIAARAGLRVAYMDLIEDYHYGAHYSFKYWLFTSLLFATRPIMPKRLRCNEMLFVLTR